MVQVSRSAKGNVGLVCAAASRRDAPIPARRFDIIAAPTSTSQAFRPSELAGAKRAVKPAALHRAPDEAGISQPPWSTVGGKLRIYALFRRVAGHRRTSANEPDGGWGVWNSRQNLFSISIGYLTHPIGLAMGLPCMERRILA